MEDAYNEASAVPIFLVIVVRPLSIALVPALPNMFIGTAAALKGKVKTSVPFFRKPSARSLYISKTMQVCLW